MQPAWAKWLPQLAPTLSKQPGAGLKETTGEEFRVFSGFYKASIRYIDLLYKALISVTTHLKNLLDWRRDVI